MTVECNDSIYASIASPKCTKCRRVLVFGGPEELLCVECKLPKRRNNPFPHLVAWRGERIKINQATCAPCDIDTGNFQ